VKALPELFRGLALGLALLAAAGCAQQSTRGSTATRSEPAAPVQEVRLLPDGRTIVFQADITYGTAKELLRLIKANPQVREIHLTSNGGLVEPALLVANAIQLRRATTFVPTNCVSACTFLFLGGEQRYLAPGAALGFHQAWRKVADRDNSLAQMNEKIRVRFEARAIEAGFVQRAMTTPSSTLWYPTADELESAGVIDGVRSASELPE
jgi:hypothetical protein